jgi:hypothetical protein
VEFKNRCRFKVYVFREIIVLEDLYDSERPTMSITNGAEEALLAVDAQVGIKGRPIIYKDTEGKYDEIIWRSSRKYGSKVVQFNWIGETDMQKAIAKCLADHSKLLGEMTFEEFNNVPVNSTF